MSWFALKMHEKSKEKTRAKDLEVERERTNIQWKLSSAVLFFLLFSPVWYCSFTVFSLANQQQRSIVLSSFTSVFLLPRDAIGRNNRRIFSEIFNMHFLPKIV